MHGERAKKIMMPLNILIPAIPGHCATSRKVADSIPDGVIGIFH